MPVISYQRVNRSLVVFLLVSMGVTLGITLIFVSPKNIQQKTIDRQTIEWLENPRKIASFNLNSETGEFNNQSLTGGWTIIAFGFLQCPDICPTTLMQMAALADKMTEEIKHHDINFVFVSVDPERDSIIEISQFVRHFDSSFLGVTGNEEQLTQLTKSLGIQFKVSSDKDNYTVAHSVKFSIIDPEAVFIGRFSPGFDVTSLIRNFKSKS